MLADNQKQHKPANYLISYSYIYPLALIMRGMEIKTTLGASEEAQLSVLVLSITGCEPGCPQHPGTEQRHVIGPYIDLSNLVTKVL